MVYPQYMMLVKNSINTSNNNYNWKGKQNLSKGMVGSKCLL